MTTQGYDKKTPGSIEAMFDDIAGSYDKCNAVLSFRLHHRWVNTLVQRLLLPSEPHTLLDLCGGTGDVAFRYLSDCTSSKEVTLLDFSAEMLQVARQRLQEEPWADRHQVTFLKADAQNIPLLEGSFEAATMAYGIRNLPDPRQGCAEACRVLKTGGRFSILELTRPSNPILRWGHSVYLQSILPRIAGTLSRNREAYEYLSRSINTFMPADELVSILESGGFVQPRVIPLLGGVASIITAIKP